MQQSIHIFLAHMYWIDILIILFILGGVWYIIHHWSINKDRRNREYNTSLYNMRYEIYSEYEKNFFL